MGQVILNKKTYGIFNVKDSDGSGNFECKKLLPKTYGIFNVKELFMKPVINSRILLRFLRVFGAILLALGMGTC